MLNFDTFFAVKRILHVRREKIYLKDFWKIKVLSCSFLASIKYPIRYFRNSVSLKASGNVEIANLFQRILNSLCRFPRIRLKCFIVSREYVKIFNRSWRLRQKSLSVHGDYGDFTVVLFIGSRLKNTKKVFWRSRRIILENINVSGEYAKSI